MGINYTKKYLNPQIPAPAVGVPKVLAEKLGQGLGVPFEIGEQVWNVKSGIDKIKQSIMVVLTTPVGRRFNQPDFGSLLPLMLFEQYTYSLEGELRQATEAALKAWVPQIFVEKVSIDMPQSNFVLIIIQYVIKGTARRETLELPYRSNDDVKFDSDIFTINRRPYFGDIDNG